MVGVTVAAIPDGYTVLCGPEPIPGACEIDLAEQIVVFQETHEDASQQPSHAGLGDFAFAPGAEGHAGAASLARGLVTVFERAIDGGIFLATGTDVVFRRGEE